MNTRINYHNQYHVSLESFAPIFLRHGQPWTNEFRIQAQDT